MDGLSVLYSSVPAPFLYEIGNAHGWLIKSAKTAAAEYHLSGRLYLAKSGWLLLAVPNALVRGVFDALSPAGVELPLAGAMNVPNVEKDILNAHISVMTAAEVTAIGADKINERGHTFRYSLGPVRELSPRNIDGISKVWAIQVASPELAALRKSYGLSPLMNDDHPFHITVAVRRKNVLRDNSIGKFDAALGRGELKAANDTGTTYDCSCAAVCTCPDTCICKKNGYCGHKKAAAHEGAPWGTPTDKLPWRERVEVYARDPKGRIYGGIWNTDKSFAVPGGGIDPGEDPGTAAIRELEEETGIKATNPRVLPIAPVDNPWSDTHRQEKQRNFAGSRTHFVAVDILNRARRKNLDKWEATNRKFYAPDAALALMRGKQFGAPAVAAGRMAALKHILEQAAKKTAADLLHGGEADGMPDSQFPPKALAEGKKHEHEHTTNDQIAGEIAKDHLQEDPAYYKKVRQIEKAAMPEIIQKLREAKEHSDNKRYDRKNAILRELMRQAPAEWQVDDPTRYHVGITHVPTQFRFHADPTIIPPTVVVGKAAAQNPYIAQLFATPISATPGASIGQRVMQYLQNVKTRGDWQHNAQENTKGLLAELDPAVKQRQYAAIASKNYPRPDFLTRLIQQRGA